MQVPGEMHGVHQLIQDLSSEKISSSVLNPEEQTVLRVALARFVPVEGVPVDEAAMQEAHKTIVSMKDLMTKRVMSVRPSPLGFTPEQQQGYKVINTLKALSEAHRRRLLASSPAPAPTPATAAAVAQVAGPVRAAPSDARAPVLPMRGVPERVEALRRLSAFLPVGDIPRERMQSMQQGGVFGQAIGDALGLFTEFRSTEEAHRILRYGQRDGKPHLSFDVPFTGCPDLHTAHLGHFRPKGWTDDTDQLMCMYLALSKKEKGKSKKSEEQLFAEELDAWSQGKGIVKERKSVAAGLGQLVGTVMGQRDRTGGTGLLDEMKAQKRLFLENPHEAARQVWCRLDYKNGMQGALIPLERRSCANGALMRTSILPMMYFDDLQKLVDKTISFSKATHADPRATACSVAFTLATALLMRNGEDHPKLSFKEIRDEVLRYAKGVLLDELEDAKSKGLLTPDDVAHLEEIGQNYCAELENCFDDSLEGLQLGQGLIGSSFKCLGSGIWALREAMKMRQEAPGRPLQEIYEDIMTRLIDQGGDADTNGAVAGSLLGAYLGVDAIPAQWREGLRQEDRGYLSKEVFPKFETIRNDIIMREEQRIKREEEKRYLDFDERSRSAEFGNQAYTPFEYEGVRYGSVNEAYAAEKSKIPPEDWQSKNRDIMKALIKAKFLQNPELKQKLLDTGSKEIRFFTVHPFWGCFADKDDLKKPGENQLGKILESVREEMVQRKASETLIQVCLAERKPIEFDEHSLLPEFGNSDSVNTPFQYEGVSYSCLNEAYHKIKLSFTGTGEEWLKVNVGIMKDLLRAKFLQNPDLKKMLLDTGSLPLYFTEPHPIWGHRSVDNPTGQNQLGMLLVGLRAEFAAHS